MSDRRDLPVRVGIYARVSTTDKDQNPETQLLPPREFVQAHGWRLAAEFIDHASATDLRGRTAWRETLAQAARRKLDLILVWKLDPAFRSVAHMATTVEQLRRWGVGLRSYSEPWLDTSGASPVGDLMLNIVASFAQFERALIAERVRAGMERARKQGRRLGRPGGTQRADFVERWEAMRPLVLSGEVSKKCAARTLGVSKSTILRLLRANGDTGSADEKIRTRSPERNGGPNAGVQNPMPHAAPDSR
jgi:DNA invertase Pin-like site-specific DNA recombinase